MLNKEAKQYWIRSVLVWETAWELLLWLACISMLLQGEVTCKICPPPTGGYPEPVSVSGRVSASRTDTTNWDKLMKIVF